MSRLRVPLILLPLCLVAAEPAPTELFLRGHSVIPSPQKVTLKPGDVRLDSSWSLDAAPHIATRTLAEGLAESHGITLGHLLCCGAQSDRVARGGRHGCRRAGGDSGAGIPADCRTGPDRDHGQCGCRALLRRADAAPTDQARRRTTLVVPQCEIDDWPRLALRFLHWDTKHHQDRMPTLKRYIDWAARFKANMIGFELEDKFAYPSNPIIGAPGAYTPAELQEIVNYGLERFVQVVPIVQAPSHMAYVLKHPQFAHLRADGNNYMSCLCLEDTYKLIFQMYDDLIAATKGVDYFYVSTDEIYYAGIGANCKLPYNPANRSAAWADFAIRARNHLAQRGRRMLAWLEYPLLDKDLERIPNDVIDGVVGEESFVEIEKRKGMRQLAYVSLQGAEFLFPDHLAIESLPAGTVMGEFESVFTSGRLTNLYSSIAGGRALRMNPIGVFGAAWDDSGLHSETFWLGWSAAARWGWKPGEPGAEQHAAEFMEVYYGPGTSGMIEVYRSMQRQARAWQITWDRVVSRVRPPGYGNSDAKGIGTARQDLTLEAPALPDPVSLGYQPRFAARYKKWVAESASLSLQNDQLRHSLSENLLRAGRNRYNLEVFLALARFTGHHWSLISGLAAAETSLSSSLGGSGEEPAGVGRWASGCRRQPGGARRRGGYCCGALSCRQSLRRAAIRRAARWTAGSSCTSSTTPRIIGRTAPLILATCSPRSRASGWPRGARSSTGSPATMPRGKRCLCAGWRSRDWKSSCVVSRLDFAFVMCLTHFVRKVYVLTCCVMKRPAQLTAAGRMRASGHAPCERGAAAGHHPGEGPGFAGRTGAAERADEADGVEPGGGSDGARHRGGGRGRGAGCAGRQTAGDAPL